MAEPPPKRARLMPPEGFTKTKPKQPVAQPPATFQSDFVQPAPISAKNAQSTVINTTEPYGKPYGKDCPPLRPPSTTKTKDTPIRAPQPLRAPDFGQRPAPQTPPADLTSRARALKLAEASGSGSSSIVKTTFTTKLNVRSPLDPPLRRVPKVQTPHLHLDSPLTPIGETSRTASPAERRALAPPPPPRPSSPTPLQVPVPPRPPETPARKPMSHKTTSAAKLLESMRKKVTPTPAVPLPGPPTLPAAMPPPPMQPLNTIHQPRPSSPEKEIAKNVSITSTRIALATDLTTAGGSAELFGVMLGASGRELRSAGEKELARGLEITPTKPKSRRGGVGKGVEREKLANRARSIYESRRLKKTLDQHAKVDALGPPKYMWRVLEVVHPSSTRSGVDKGFPSGGRENEGNAMLIRCVKDDAQAEEMEETMALLSACVARVIAGSSVRVWAPVVVVESEREKVLLCARYTVDEAPVK
ncbi:unnamed protein product [Peniophora sp. CBMAI 1063]|nr:unnamed protein product [Peniophora sp. CBMAI 1063]